MALSARTCSPAVAKPSQRAGKVAAPFSGRSRQPVCMVRAEAAAAPAVAAPAAAGKPTELSGQNFTPLRDINSIMQTLPHRYPFLLVDRVIEWEKEKYAVGYKCVTINDNFFTGHFPDRPIMPGVLQVEAMAQLAGIVMLDPADTAAKQLFFFGGIEGCRFRKPVVPGDVLMMRVDITKYNKRFGVVKAAAKGYVGEELVVEAELTLAMGK